MHKDCGPISNSWHGLLCDDSTLAWTGGTFDEVALDALYRSGAAMAEIFARIWCSTSLLDLAGATCTHAHPMQCHNPVPQCSAQRSATMQCPMQCPSLYGQDLVSLISSSGRYAL